MEITLNRFYFGNSYVIGRLLINGNYFCDTLEDVNRDLNKNGKFDSATEKKIKGETCIPFGIYEVKLTFSNRFKRVLPELLNVPNFTGIRIHSGNTQADTEGCILVGKNLIKGKVSLSRLYFKQLNTILVDSIGRGEKITISIN